MRWLVMGVLVVAGCGETRAEEPDTEGMPGWHVASMFSVDFYETTHSVVAKDGAVYVIAPGGGIIAIYTGDVAATLQGPLPR